MGTERADTPGVPVLAPARLCVGLTGHRAGNAAFDRNADGVQAALERVFDAIDSARSRIVDSAPVRLATLLASGSDLLGANSAIARGWEIVAPVPFGMDLNIAINAEARSREDTLALIAGSRCGDPVANAYAEQVKSTAARATLFELAEQDERVTELLLAMLDDSDTATARAYRAVASDRAAMAGAVMIEQSDVLIAIWDGITPGAVGGTRHTMVKALNDGLPVIWIDARAPDRLRILRNPEAMLADGDGSADLDALVNELLDPESSEQHAREIGFNAEQWHPRSQRRFHGYRRIEAVFGGAPAFSSLVQVYETPKTIVTGSGRALLEAAGRLPGGDRRMLDGVRTRILGRFAWADGLSTYLSDAYRGGMVTNFLLSALAIIGGVAYLPFVPPEGKWPFAMLEFVVLLAILGITSIGRRRDWHRRWFETRRVAEYLRHAPILLLLGVARPAGRWPRAASAEWPEHHARRILRDLGLPRIRVSQQYLRQALEQLLGPHVRSQRDYHAAKSKRLAGVHHRLDRLSARFFALAVISVVIYLGIVALEALGLIEGGVAAHVSKIFTLLGVAFPALGGAFAGIRYFGDFERFAAISEVAAEKLAQVNERIELLLAAAPGALTFGQVAALAHALDTIVSDEIENWQAVFAGKQIAVPV